MLKQVVKRLPPIKRLIEERDEARANFQNATAQVDSLYYNEIAMRSAVKMGGHRDVIGGSWNDLGQLQLSFLLDQGLLQNHCLLDVGCGSLRGGVKYIPFLEPGNYWGVDISSALLEAGWEHELGPAGLQPRQPREQLVVLRDFEFESLGNKFDTAIAISVFTHLSLNNIRRCLARLAPVMKPSGKFYATFFYVPNGENVETPVKRAGRDTITHSNRDPFHYRFEDIEYATSGLPISVYHHGEWGHPRGQQMLLFQFE